MVMNLASEQTSECYFLEIFSEVTWTEHRLSNTCTNINKIKADDTEARPVKH